MGSRGRGPVGRGTSAGRARVAVLVAGAVVVAAVGGAVVALRSGDGTPAGRQRHQAAGPAWSPERSTTQAGSVIDPRSPSSADGVAGRVAGAGVSAAPGSSSTSSPAATVAVPTTSPARAASPAPAAKPHHEPAAPTPAPAPAAGVPPAGGLAANNGWSTLPAAPIGGRVDHAAVWTGREMVVWGGQADLDSDPLTDGAAYDPATRTWRKLPAAPLSPRYDPTAVWTGREMLVFGGTSAGGDILADGAAWDPAANRWRALPASPLGPRDGAVVAWAGDRLVVWGGATVPPDAPADPASPGDTPAPPASEMKADGAAYVPATDSWVPVAGAPLAARSGAESVWTGSRLLITGGYHEGDDDDRRDGAALDPVSGTWAPIAARPAPGSCGADHPCAGWWTGAVALFPASGLAYDPAADHWSAMPPYPSADSSLAAAPAVWTGSRLLAWGAPTDGTPADAGDADPAETPSPPAAGAYDPAANAWQPLAAGPLKGRVLHTAVWTGQALIVWGGTDGDAGLADGAAFHPAA